MNKTHKIDASGKSLGRIASEAAVLLRGKNLTSFAKNTIPEVSVEIVNASKMNIRPEKRRNTKYETYSGYPGGLKFQSLEEMITKKGYGEALRNAIHGMLPINSLRDRLMKRLNISE